MQEIAVEGTKADGECRKESKRARVKRLLLTRLEEEVGFRRPRTIPEDDFRKRLGRLADALAYMSDKGLRLLFDMLKSKGQGRDRNQWPPRATFYAYAELIEPCPLELVPSLKSWIGSKAGPAAAHRDELVEVVDYIQKYKRPPNSDKAARYIKGQADARRRDHEYIREQIARGAAETQQVTELERYDQKLNRAKAFLPESHLS